MIEAPSGAGKSDMMLRAFDRGFALVSDDRTLVWSSGGCLYGRAPDRLSGRIEVRGLGVVDLSALRLCRIVLCVRDGSPDRMPEPAIVTHAGCDIPLLVLPLLEASTPAKLGRAISHLGG